MCTMKIPLSNLNFKGAAISVSSFSDNHGNLERLDNFYRSIEDNRDELFLEDKKGNQNVLLIIGDWFISGGTRGYKSNPDANSHDFQILFFNKLVEKICTIARNTKTFFVSGNHELDGGVLEFKKVLSKIKAKILMTNLDFKLSPVLKSLIDKKKIVQEEILEIDDDKRDDIKHKALLLGISPVNMPYYKKDLDGLKFINQFAKSGKATTVDDYKETLEDAELRIRKFKKKNPKGIVIVSSHTGVDFAQNIAKNMGKENIDLILNAHEHKDTVEEVNGVKIVNLNQNFNKYVNAKFFIDDNGDLKSDVVLNSYYPVEFSESEEEGEFGEFYNKAFDKDLKREYKIVPMDKSAKVLDIKGIRAGNNYLANFATDSILSQIQKTNPEVQIFAINATAIRSSLYTSLQGGANNLQVMNVLNGIIFEDAGIYKNTLSGKMLTKLVVENALFSEINPDRNPVTHYSGLIADNKSILEGYHQGKGYEELSKFIKTTDYEPIDLDKEYTIANVEKYFRKSKVPFIHEELYNKAVPLNLNAKELFIQYVNENKDNLSAKCDKRLID